MSDKKLKRNVDRSISIEGHDVAQMSHRTNCCLSQRLGAASGRPRLDRSIIPQTERGALAATNTEILSIQYLFYQGLLHSYLVDQFK